MSFTCKDQGLGSLSASLSLWLWPLWLFARFELWWPWNGSSKPWGTSGKRESSKGMLVHLCSFTLFRRSSPKELFPHSFILVHCRMAESWPKMQLCRLHHQLDLGFCRDLLLKMQDRLPPTQPLIQSQQEPDAGCHVETQVMDSLQQRHAPLIRVRRVTAVTTGAAPAWLHEVAMGDPPAAAAQGLTQYFHPPEQKDREWRVEISSPAPMETTDGQRRICFSAFLLLSFLLFPASLLL